MNTPCIYCGHEDVTAVTRDGGSVVRCLWCDKTFRNPNWRNPASTRRCPKCGTTGQLMSLWASEQYECPQCLYVFSGAPGASFQTPQRG